MGPCREEGLKGLWRGLGPNVARNAIVNAAELASFDQASPAQLLWKFKRAERQDVFCVTCTGPKISRAEARAAISIAD